MVQFVIRVATEQDCDAIANLIRELAIYEKFPTDSELSGDDLRRDGFGDEPLFKCKVAEVINEDKTTNVVGYAFYYFVYSTWKGKVLHLEDLYVQSLYRGKGIGTELFEDIKNLVKATGSHYLSYVVLDWNKSAIDFYEKRGAKNLTKIEGWNMFRLE